MLRKGAKLGTVIRPRKWYYVSPRAEVTRAGASPMGGFKVMEN
jgi:hypothetical protein